MIAIRGFCQLILLPVFPAVMLALFVSNTLLAEEIRYVPQLELTNLDPVKVAFHPQHGSRLLVVNDLGRIDLFDIDNPDRPIKTAEIHARASDAAFNPAGDRLVSGGADGTVRLWALDGKPTAAPFRGHESSVFSVAFNPAGDRIVSGGADGTVRLWDIATGTGRVVFRCHWPRAHGVRSDRWAIQCPDRIVALDDRFSYRGAIFWHEEGLVALTDHGALASSEELGNLVRAFDEDGTSLTRVGAVQVLSGTDLRQQLWDDYTIWERARMMVIEAWKRTKAFYADLGWLKAPFWPALG